MIHSIPHKLNLFTASFLGLGGWLTVKEIAPFLGILVILITIAVNILSWRNKVVERKNHHLETKNHDLETRKNNLEICIAQETLKQLKAKNK